MEVEEYQYDYFRSYIGELNEKQQIKELVEKLKTELENVKQELSAAYEIIAQQEED
jgi:hypothetical protein